MPTNFECESCHLSFTIGWYHYHDFSNGYAAKTRLVCKLCGTMHAIEHAITLGACDDVESSLVAFDLPEEQQPDRLLAQPGPLFVDIAERERAAGVANLIDQLIAVVPKLHDWIKCNTSGYIRPLRTARPIPTVGGSTGAFALEDYPCYNCGETASLVSEWPDSQKCPRCGGSIISKGSWQT